MKANDSLGFTVFHIVIASNITWFRNYVIEFFDDHISYISVFPFQLIYMKLTRSLLRLWKS